MMVPEALALLGLPADYDKDALSSAYRRLVRLVHPDRMAGASRQELDDASALLARVNEANEVLGRALRARSADRPATGPQPTPRPEPSGPKRPPMSFEMFSRSYEESVWSSARQHAPKQSMPFHAAPSAPSRTPSAATTTESKRFPPAVTATIVVVAALLLLVVGIWGASGAGRGDPSADAGQQSPEPSPSLTGGAYSDGSYLADSVDDPSCSSAASCWQWRISGIASCDTAKVTVGFGATSGAADDYTRRYTVSGMASGDVQVLTVDSTDSTDSDQYAGIDDITCA